MAQKRPNPTSLLEGQPAVNLNVSEPGLFFKATDGTLFKVGPVAITSGDSAPNAAAAGPAGNVAGETWLDGRATLANAVMKVYNGTQWVTASGFQVDNSNGNFSLSKTLTVSTLIANGTGANAYIRVPNGPLADEATITPAAGMVRFDTTTNYFRGYDGTTWIDLSGGNLTNLSVSGNAQINGTLDVDGNVTLGNDDTIDTLQVNAAATFSNGVTVGTDSSDLLSVNSATTFAAATRHINQQPLRFHAGTVAGSNYVALRAPSSIAANVTWTLPNADGGAGTVLTTDGAGNLTWNSPTATAAGLNGQVQFNNLGLLGASSLLVIDSVQGEVNIEGDLLPTSDDTYNLGSSTKRFANIYTGDLHLANGRGDWTMIEESDYLSLRNNKTGKTFRLLMEEVDS